MKLTKEKLEKLISELVLNGNINFTIGDIDKKQIIYTTKNCYEMFGMPEDLPYDDAMTYWFDHIVHPDDREEQKEIIESKNFPNTRIYRTVHPTKGTRYIRVQTSDPMEIYGRRIIVSLPVDITNG